MQRVKQILLVVVFLAFGFLGVIFASENPSVQTLQFLSYQTPELSIGLIVMMALFFGTILGWLLSRISVVFINRSLVKQQKILQKKEEEIRTLRLASIKE